MLTDNKSVYCSGVHHLTELAKVYREKEGVIWNVCLNFSKYLQGPSCGSLKKFCHCIILLTILTWRCALWSVEVDAWTRCTGAACCPVESVRRVLVELTDLPRVKITLRQKILALCKNMKMKVQVNTCTSRSVTNRSKLLSPKSRIISIGDIGRNCWARILV